MTVEVVEPVPARTRMLARAQRRALLALLVLLVVAVGASWVAGLLVDADAGASLRAHLVVLALLAMAALAIARRSTRFVEGVFGQQDRMLRTVVHEVRAPLGRLLAAVDEGRSGVRPADEALDEVGEEGEAVSEFINDLTEAARVFSGVLAVPTERAVLAELVCAPPRADVLKGAVVAPEPGPGAVIGSPRLLRLALANLIRNAAQHAYQGGPGVIRVVVDDRGIAVLDDGPGVDPNRLVRLTGAAPGGLPNRSAGFGLTIAGWVAELHGGQLRLANRSDGGFEARLDLPVLISSDM
jgi:signal transduction histidine kinase